MYLHKQYNEQLSSLRMDEHNHTHLYAYAIIYLTLLDILPSEGKVIIIRVY